MKQNDLINRSGIFVERIAPRQALAFLFQNVQFGQDVFLLAKLLLGDGFGRRVLVVPRGELLVGEDCVAVLLFVEFLGSMALDAICEFFREKNRRPV